MLELDVNRTSIGQGTGYMISGTVKSPSLGMYDLKKVVSGDGCSFENLQGKNQYGVPISKSSNLNTDGIKTIEKTTNKHFIQEANGKIRPLFPMENKIFSSLRLLGKNIELANGNKLVCLVETIQKTKKPGGQWQIDFYKLGNFDFLKDSFVSEGLLKYKDVMNKQALKAVSEHIQNLLKLLH